jgi:hypothetical protein
MRTFRHRLRVAAYAFAMFACTNAIANVDIPSGASVNLNGGTLDLSGTSLQVDGTFGVGAGNVDNAANVAIGSGASLAGGSGAINLSGDWANLGSFTAGSSHVNFVDGALAQSSISGNTTFATLSLISAVGKSYVFQVGTTQTITALLQILGTAATGIQVKSSAPGQVASINLAQGGSQNIDFVGVSNIHATGQHLAATKTNDGGTGDAIGWFGSVVAAIQTSPAPTLSALGMLLMTIVMWMVAWRRRAFGSF